MATKDSYMSAKDGQQASYGNNSSSINNTQFNNLNLNSIRSNSSLNPVHSESISTQIRSASTKIPDFNSGNDYHNERRNNSNALMTTSTTGLYPRPSEYADLHKPYESERDDKNPSKNTKSTLSLHIAAYENSVEAAAGNQDKQDNSGESAKSDDKKSKKGKIGKTFRNVKNFFTGALSKEGALPEDSRAPETMPFTQSRKLFDVKNQNRLSSMKNKTIAKNYGLSVSSRFHTMLPGLNLSQENVISRQLLGKAIALGDLFDARKDAFCGSSLFFKSVDSCAKIREIQEPPFTKCIMGNSLNAKFESLGIDGDVKLSVLSGLTGSEEQNFLLNHGDNVAVASLIIEITTKLEAIDVGNRAVAKQISSQAINDSPSATNVVIGIQKGIRAIATLTSICQNESSRESMENELQLALCELGSNIHGEMNGFSESSLALNAKFNFQIHGLNGNLPQTLEEASSFMKSLPKMINGRELPISCIMLPFTSLGKDFKKMDLSHRIVFKADESVVGAVVDAFNELYKSLNLITSMDKYFSERHCYFKDEIIADVSSKLREINGFKEEFKKQLNDILMDVRCGRKPSSALISILPFFYKSRFTFEAISSYRDQLYPYSLKANYIQRLERNKVICIGKNNSVEAERKKLNLDDCYEYYCDWSNEKDRDENSKLFIDLVNDGRQMIFVDSEVSPLARNSHDVPDGNRICQYLNGSYIDIDYLQTWKKDQSRCYAKCIGKRQPLSTIPTKHVNVNLPCPQSFKEGCCSNVKTEWYCADCEEKLQYGFNHHFFCSCGTAPVNAYQYSCSDSKHGNSYIDYDEDKLFTLVDEIRPKKEYNYLLLGESGVGKTTWINSFANHQTYSTLAEAEMSGKPICLIPSQFTSTVSVNGKRVTKTIQIGESKNENFKKGESATQEPQSHVFTVGDKLIRIIDTPGIGDPRGAATDDKNFASILKFISQFDEIHGICILLKPNESRLNLVFKYCINGLLSHLHKSAAKNITFCFTRVRESFYEPGDTWPILEEYAKKLQEDHDIKLDLSDESVYCQDNEAFRFLHLLINGGEFSDDERAIYAKSWEMSVKENQRLLNHFENDVEPHIVSETVSLNEARKIILTAAKPLADITKNIQQNIKAINRQRNEIQQANAYDFKLRGKLMINHIGIQTRPLGYPRTVCRSIGCTDTKRMPNTEVDKVIYKTVCHEHCLLQNVTPEIAPNPDLQGCVAMNANLSCNECGCRWDTHLHITFEQEEIEEEVEDENVRRSINQNKSAIEVQQEAIKVLEQRIDEYKKSQADIDRILAKFASFLKKNAILVYNDTIEDYLKLNIRDEKEQKFPNQELLRKMEEQLAQYREEKRILDSRLASGEAEHVQYRDIKTLQKELEDLPLVGQDFKMLFDAHVQGVQTNLQLGEQHFDPSSQNTKVQKSRRTRKNNSFGNAGGQNNWMREKAVAVLSGSMNYLLWPRN